MLPDITLYVISGAKQNHMYFDTFLFQHSQHFYEYLVYTRIVFMVVHLGKTLQQNYNNIVENGNAYNFPVQCRMIWN